MEKIAAPFRYLAIGLIYFYRLAISPLLGPKCRFTPSCSEYSILAIKRFGVFKGVWLGGKRLLKCHPLHPGGHDPVPEAEDKKS